MIITFIKHAGLLAIVFLTATAAASTPTGDTDVQPGDWTYKQTYDYILKQNDTAANAIAPAIKTYVETTGINWDQLYDGGFKLEGGLVMTVKESAHARALMGYGSNSRALALKKRLYFGYLSAYLWSNNCNGDVGWTWYSDGSDLCVSFLSNGKVLRMYSVYAYSYWNGPGGGGGVESLAELRLNQDTHCGSAFAVYPFSSNGCFGTSGGIGFMSVLATTTLD